MNKPLKYTDPSGWSHVVAVGGGTVFTNLGDYCIYLRSLDNRSSYYSLQGYNYWERNSDITTHYVSDVGYMTSDQYNDLQWQALSNGYGNTEESVRNYMGYYILDYFVYTSGLGPDGAPTAYATHHKEVIYPAANSGGGDINYWGLYNWGHGTFASGLELSTSTFRLTKGGLLSPKLYTSGWLGGSRAGINTFSVAKTGKLLGVHILAQNGELGLGIGTAVDLIGVGNYYLNPDAKLVTSPGKAGLNFGIGLYALKLNPIAGIVYFGVDATIGWDEAFRIQAAEHKLYREVYGDRYSIDAIMKF